MTNKEIFQILLEHVKEILAGLENYDFKGSDSLKDLGANSIDRAEIINMTMESINLDIPRIELFGAKNIGELVDILYEKKSMV